MKKHDLNSEFIRKMEADGWVKKSSGETRQIDYNDKFAFFVKFTPILEILKISKESASKNPCISTENGFPLKNAMGNYKRNETDKERPNSSPVLSTHWDILNSLQLDSDSLCISCCCFYSDCPNNSFSYSFSLIHHEFLYRFLFIPLTENESEKELLPIDVMLSRILDHIGLKRYNRQSFSTYKYINHLDDNGNPVVEVCSYYSTASDLGKYGFIKTDSNKPSSVLLSDLKTSDKENYKGVVTVFNKDSVPSVSITLIGFHCLQFLSSLDSESAYSTNLLSTANSRHLCSSIPNCIFTSTTLSITMNSVLDNGWVYVRNISLNIRDITSHLFDSNLTFNDIGTYAGVIPLNPVDKDKCFSYEANLDQLLLEDPVLFASYAAYRVNAVLIYMTKIWGVNKNIPATLNSRCSEVVKGELKTIYSAGSDTDFYSSYNGTYLTKGSLKKSAKETYNRNGSYMPLNIDCDKILLYASRSYRGGYNGCFSVDCHTDYNTYDLDIVSAYPTAMALIPAIDWSDCIEKKFEHGHILTLDDFMVDGVENPMAPIFVAATFSFPEHVKYPCLIRCDENDTRAPMYPTSEASCVYLCGPELYLALKLGAEIRVHSGYKARILHNSFSEALYPFRTLARKFVKARKNAENTVGKTSMEARTLKFLINSTYGKTGQGVKDLYLPARKNDYSESPISNPYFAAVTTSFVRAVVFAALNSITNAGAHVYSATTDGLITDIDPEELKKMDLYGFNPLLLLSRQLLTDETNPETWSAKHEQNDLLNLTTRGNASLSKDGVIAMNGLPREFKNSPKEHPANRISFVEKALSREKKLQYEKIIYPNLKEVIRKNPYIPKKSTSSVSLDFDLKRKPIRSTLKAEHRVINGVEYEIAHFETEPYKNTEEYLLYQEVKDSMTCLRTVSDWNKFFNRVELKSKGCSHLPKSDGGDYTWSILCACIIGYKAKLWDIPYLDTPGLSVDDKVKWINTFNSSEKHTYNKSNWNRASDKKAQKNVLPKAVVQDMLDTMNSYTPEKEPPQEDTTKPEYDKVAADDETPDKETPIDLEDIDNTNDEDDTIPEYHINPFDKDYCEYDLPF